VDEVRIDYPDGTPDGHFSAVLLLFVDETGRVRHIRVREGNLTPGLEAAARAAFYAASFTPGEQADRPVRSIYPVEVNFAAEPSARNAGTR
jgi:outer membrane biosynthesis protein TonB